MAAQENLEQRPLQLMLPHHITKVKKLVILIVSIVSAIGPLERHEIPFDDIKISRLMTKIKPNGRVRVILNLSKGDPYCVNQGTRKEDFPTLMGSIKKFIVMLNSCGRGAQFCKNDWAAAYKQVS